MRTVGEASVNSTLHNGRPSRDCEVKITPLSDVLILI
jgi:hypothetical protein